MILLSAYITHKIKKDDAKNDSDLLKKYAKLAFLAFILKKLKSAKSENKEKLRETKEIELGEIEEGSKVKERKHIVTGALVGVIGVLAGIMILFAAKKKMDKRHKYKVAVK